jgi:hypothetical protein
MQLFNHALFHSMVLRPDNNTAAYRSPKLQTQHGPVEAEESPSYGNKSIAIATTVLHPDPTLPIWLDYHLRCVHVVLILMDDPRERSIFQHMTQGRRVVLFDEALH